MRFSVVQSKCVGKDSQNGESDYRPERRKGRPKESEIALDHADRGDENIEEKRKGGVNESGKCDPKSPHLSDHQDDKGDDHEELDETPVLSMHHFSATQWQNQSAMDITSMVADTPYTYDEDDDEDDDNDNDSESGTSPALGGNKANDSPTAKKGFGGDRDSIDEDNGRDLSSFSMQDLKKLRDRFNTTCSTATGVTIAANAAGADPTPSNASEISASFHRALFSMAIRREEKSIVHDDEDDDEERRIAGRAKPGEEEDDDEGGSGHNDIMLPKLLEYTTILE